MSPRTRVAALMVVLAGTAPAAAHLGFGWLTVVRPVAHVPVLAGPLAVAVLMTVFLLPVRRSGRETPSRIGVTKSGTSQA